MAINEAAYVCETGPLTISWELCDHRPGARATWLKNSTEDRENRARIFKPFRHNGL